MTEHEHVYMNGQPCECGQSMPVYAQAQIDQFMAHLKNATELGMMILELPTWKLRIIRWLVR